jgi:hypothetical protein
MSFAKNDNPARVVSQRSHLTWRLRFSARSPCASRLSPPTRACRHGEKNEYANGSQVDQSFARKTQQEPEGEMEETETAAAVEALAPGKEFPAMTPSPPKR